MPNWESRCSEFLFSNCSYKKDQNLFNVVIKSLDQFARFAQSKLERNDHPDFMTLDFEEILPQLFWYCHCYFKHAITCLKVAG